MIHLFLYFDVVGICTQNNEYSEHTIAHLEKNKNPSVTGIIMTGLFQAFYHSGALVAVYVDNMGVTI